MPQIKNATPTIYNGVKYRSKLEARCAKILDEAGIKFEYETLVFELLPAFVYKGKKYRPWTYTSDFLIFNNVLLEIKGFKKADNYVNKRKMILKHLIDHNMNYDFYEIYSESHLKNVLYLYNKLNDFNLAYAEYDAELTLRQKEHKAKKLKKK